MINQSFLLFYDTLGDFQKVIPSGVLSFANKPSKSKYRKESGNNKYSLNVLQKCQ